MAENRSSEPPLLAARAMQIDTFHALSGGPGQPQGFRARHSGSMAVAEERSDADDVWVLSKRPREGGRKMDGIKVPDDEPVFSYF